MAAPVVHFEIHASDPARCRAFYERAFGWKTNDVPGMEQQYWLMYPEGGPAGDTGSRGIAGGMLMRRGDPPAEGQAVNAFVCILEVEDVEAASRVFREAGGQIAVPPMEVPGVGRIFYGKDTEGNILGVLQPSG